MAALVEFNTTHSLQSQSLSTGYPFYYWPKYKFMHHDGLDHHKHDDEQSTVIGKELYVEKKHDTFFEEMLNYKSISRQDIEEVMSAKLPLYTASTIVRQSIFQPHRDLYNVDLVYGINPGDAISEEHLMSVILYTDYPELARDFSASFKPLSLFESLSQTKLRNAEYYWMSRRLREAVECFGDHGSRQEDGALKGPFYCSIRFVAVFPQFQLRLASPTSTSTALEVARKLTDENTMGVLLQVNNTVIGHHYLRGFNCSWLSQFKEEAEVLFIGGHYRIAIESVTVMDDYMLNNDSYQQSFLALQKLSRLVNGNGIALNFTAEQIAVLQILWRWKLNKMPMETDMHDYIYQIFEVYSRNTTKVVLNLYQLEKTDRRIKGLFVYGQSKVIKKDIFEIFPNLCCVEIYASKMPFSLKALLTEIKRIDIDQILIKEEIGKYHNGKTKYRTSSIYNISKLHRRKKSTPFKYNNDGWVETTWTTSKEYLQRYFEQRGYRISFATERKVNAHSIEKSENCLKIKRSFATLTIPKVQRFQTMDFDKNVQTF